MPKVALGTWQQSNFMPGKEGSDAHEVKDAVKVAIKAGYRHIDTAWAYFNEGQIGQALKELFQEGVVKREDIFITTKLFSFFHHKEDVEKVLREQLAALGLSYVDMYLIHGPVPGKRDPEHPMTLFPMKDGKPALDMVDHMETWQAMENCVRKGLTKAIGISNFNARQIKRIYDNATIKPHCLQVECHAYFPQDELFDLCSKLNIAFQAYGPIGSPGAQAVYKAMGRPQTMPILVEDPTVVQIAQKHHKTPAQVLLRWLYQRGMVVLPKSTNEKRIKENFDIFNFTLDKDDCEALKKLKRGRILGGVADLMKGHPENPFTDPY
jgi:diketogulonate reductase-like aldo/keto reductase